MKLLAIETSCDETSAAIVEKKDNSDLVTLHSNVISSSLPIHATTGGIIPETAAREQIKYIIPVIKKALSDANTNHTEIDGIAVTIGPGLIGSLLVGVETAKALSYAWNMPIIPVNHLFGHLYANFIQTADSNSVTVDFPAIGLIISGGHTDLILIKNHGDILWLGGTRDDAAGEAFDKVGRLLGFPYPAGQTIEQKALKGNPKAFNFPRPMIGTKDFDFSFSGLKTAVLRETQQLGNPTDYTPSTVNDLCASLQHAIIDVVVRKTTKAAEKYEVKSILLGGGVAANQTLTNKLGVMSQELGVAFFVPQKSLCTDNAAMIGAAAFFNEKPTSWDKLTANPELYFD